MYPPFYSGSQRAAAATRSSGGQTCAEQGQQQPQQPVEEPPTNGGVGAGTNGHSAGDGGGDGMAPLSIEQGGTNGGDDNDSHPDVARAAEIEKAGDGTAAASAGGGSSGGLMACCVSYWKGYSTGWTLVGVGLLLMALSALIRARFDGLFESKLKEKLAVSSMDQAQATPHWFGNAKVNTPSLVSLFFYNLTNAPQFLEGQPPAFDLVGPYTYRTYYHKADVAFPNDGHSVEFAVNQKQVYQPDKSQTATDEVPVTVINTGYVSAVARKRSESNIARAGVPRILQGYHDKALPQLNTDLRALLLGGWDQRAGDFSTAVAAMQAKLGAPEFAQRWASGGFGQDTEAEVATLLEPMTKEDAAYARTLLDTGTDLQLPLPLAQALLDPLDANSLTAANTPGAKARVGLLLWAGPVAGKAPMLTHFQGMTQAHADAITAYVGRMLGGTEVEARLLEAVALGPEFKTVDDLAWRQFTVTDVLSRLSANGADAAPTAIQGTSLGLLGQGNVYVAEPLTAEGEAVPMVELGYSLRSLKPRPTLPLTAAEAAYLPAAPKGVAAAAAQWGKGNGKGKCLLDVLLRNKTYYETQLLGIPDVLVTDDFAQTYALQSAPLEYGPIELCMEVEAQSKDTGLRPVMPDWADVQTYINYIGQQQISGLIRLLVVNNNGGLVITRTVKELALGHVEPLFVLSLGPDHPASKAAAILSNSPFPLDAPQAFCTSSADVLHPLWSCKLDPEASNATTKIYRKVPSRFATGKSPNIDSIGAQQSYFNHSSDIEILYPSSQESLLVNLATGVQQIDNAGAGTDILQKGFSTGEQFVPLKMRDIADPQSLWLLRQKGPMPMRYDYADDAAHYGVQARRFTLADPLFVARPGLTAAPAPTEALKPPTGAKRAVAAPENAHRSFLRRRRRKRWLQEQEQGPQGLGMQWQTAKGQYPVSLWINVTLGNYVPQYMAQSAAAGLQDDPVLKALSPQALQRAKEVDGPSYIDVEPWTGKTIGQRNQLQVSLATTDPAAGSYDLFYKTAYQGPWLGTLFAVSDTQLAEKEAMAFKLKLFGPKRAVKGATLATFPLGALLMAFGAAIVYRTWDEKKKKKEARRRRREERRRRRAERAAAAAGAAESAVEEGNGGGNGEA